MLWIKIYIMKLNKIIHFFIKELIISFLLLVVLNYLIPCYYCSTSNQYFVINFCSRSQNYSLIKISFIRGAVFWIFTLSHFIIIILITNLYKLYAFMRENLQNHLFMLKIIFGLDFFIHFIDLFIIKTARIIKNLSFSCFIIMNYFIQLPFFFFTFFSITSKHSSYISVVIFLLLTFVGFSHILYKLDSFLYIFIESYSFKLVVTLYSID